MSESAVPNPYARPELEESRVAALARLTIASYAVGLIRFVWVAFFDPDGAMGGAASAAPGWALGIGGVIGLALFTGLYALVYFPLLKRRPWARVLGTVLAALSISGSVVEATAIFAGSLVTPLIAALWTVVNVLFIVRAWRR